MMIDAFEIPCRDLVEMLTDYIEGNLDALDAERVDAHLSVCPPCVDVLEQFRRVIRMTGELREEEVERVEPHVRAELIHAFSSLWRGDGT
jgi:predicted anti-sigma-YlaC factor YlaD